MRVVLLAKTPNVDLIRMLRAAGHELWHTPPGDRAYRRTRDNFPQAVLVDLSEAADLGFENAQELAKNPRTASTPVILYNAEDVARARSRAPYVRALLSAPSRFSDLVRALSAFEAAD